ncbi:MAG: ABC transporter ATP-binding protein [Mesorhizobium sp.]|nr:MAG: ABC transporter ATP-binding protein [Mesorhizobium sp.]
MSSDRAGVRGSGVAVRVRDVSKHYVMFERPEDRFKQMVVPRLERLIGRPPRRYFRDFAALSGVSLEIGRGETVGIIGRNGSGKSTLLQIICGTLQPTSGSVEVNGRIAALLELGAGFNPEFTGRENVFLNASILGVPRKEMEWRFDDIARFADIGSFIDQPVKTYSSGMYVRLAFATAINVDPDILVVDEALAVGDEAFQRKCFARIEQIKDNGGTILFVSHGAQTIVQLCSRAILMDAGELILQGRPKTIVAQYQRLVNASPEAASEIRTGIVEAAGILRASDQNQELNRAPEDRGLKQELAKSQAESVSTVTRIGQQEF